jgi:hypothetical protein
LRLIGSELQADEAVAKIERRLVQDDVDKS